jgi:hypothetical protein
MRKEKTSILDSALSVQVIAACMVIETALLLYLLSDWVTR